MFFRCPASTGQGNGKFAVYITPFWLNVSSLANVGSGTTCGLAGPQGTCLCLDLAWPWSCGTHSVLVCWFPNKGNIRGGSNESQCIMPGFWFRCLEGEGHVLCFVPSGHFGQSFWDSAGCLHKGNNCISLLHLDIVRINAFSSVITRCYRGEAPSIAFFQFFCFFKDMGKKTWAFDQSQNLLSQTVLVYSYVVQRSRGRKTATCIHASCVQHAWWPPWEPAVLHTVQGARKGQELLRSRIPSSCRSAQLASCMREYTVLFNPISEHLGL